jgi:hypothetical protein
MALKIIEPTDFLDNDLFKQDHSTEGASSYDWSALKGKRVPVRGCQSVLIPPWTFMYLMGKPAPYARAVLFGNERDSAAVFMSTQSS